MGKKRGGGKGEDEELWRRVAATVKPYADPRKAAAKAKKDAKTAASAPVSPSPSGALQKINVRKIKAADAARYNSASGPARGFDAATERRLKRGQLGIDGRLDLHGLTQAAARDALARFVAEARRQERRTLLVITGKSGVLRRLAPQWLAEMPEAVIAATPARPKDGGDGALYVRLRRKD
jgi:DNA-nicking Smr family endonuclease